MPDDFLTNSKIVSAYREKTPASAACAREAREHFPSGLTHDSRRLQPYGLYVDRPSCAQPDVHRESKSLLFAVLDANFHRN